jgi:hypothetical protein
MDKSGLTSKEASNKANMSSTTPKGLEIDLSRIPTENSQKLGT